MKKLIIVLSFLFVTVAVSAQAKDSLISDETTYTELKTYIKIKTSNETIREKLMQLDWSNISRSKDKQEYSFYFKKEEIERIKLWIAKL